MTEGLLAEKHRGRTDEEEEGNTSCRGANLLDAAGVLFHGDLLCRRLKAKERLYIQAGGLFKARPVLVLWMHLKKRDNTSSSLFWLFKCSE